MRRLLWVSLSLLPLVAGAQESTAGSKAADAGTAATATAPAADAGSAAQANSPIARFDALWPRRDDPAVLKQLHKTLDEALTKNPGDYEGLWRAAKLIQWEADGATNDDYKKAYGRHCWDFADKAKAKDPSRIEGYYYGAACIGAYSESIGILSALSQGLEGKFNERLDKAISMNPRFNTCAPLIAKARYFYKLPWPKRDLDKSAEWFHRAIAACPNSLRAYLWLAETELDQDHAQQAKATLQKALQGSVDYDPPEGRRVKAWAAPLEKKIEKELQ